MHRFIFQDQLKVNAASSKLSGGTTLIIDNGAAFDIPPSGNASMLLTAYNADASGTLTSRIGVVEASGLAGNTLTVDTGLAIPSGAVLGNVITAREMNDIYNHLEDHDGRLEVIESDYVSIGDLDEYYTSSAVDTLLLGKANASTVNGMNTRLTTVETNYISNDVLASGLALKEPVIASGTTSQFYRGDKSWQNISSITSGLASTSYVDSAVSPKANSSDVYTKSQIDTSLAGKANSSTTYSKTDVDTLLGSKADTSNVYSKTASDAKYALITTTDSLDSRVDTLEATPKPTVLIARWVLAMSSDLTSGSPVVELADVPVNFTITHVTVNAQTNPSGGGFTFNITVDGTNIFSSAQSYSANTTASSSFTSFANSGITALDQIGVNIASVGTGVKNVTISLWGKES